MSLEIRSISTGGRAPSGAGPGSINKPTGCVDGDLLIYFISSTSGTDCVLPAGFTEIIDKSGSTASARCGYKVASSEPSSYAFSGNSSAGLFAVIYCIKGQNLATPIDGSNSASGTGTSASSSGVTPTAANGMAIIYVAANNNTTFSAENLAVSPPTFVEDAEGAAAGVPGDLAYVAASGIRSAATATGNATATIGTSSNWTLMLVYVAEQPDQTYAQTLFSIAVSPLMFPFNMPLLQTGVQLLSQLIGDWVSVGKTGAPTWNNDDKS